MHHKYNNTKRCSICDTTNNLMVENLPGQYKKSRRGYTDFLPDPLNKKSFICVSCNESIEQVRNEFLIRDLEKEFEDDSNR